jgi:hypothetical protein
MHWSFLLQSQTHPAVVMSIVDYAAERGNFGQLPSWLGLWWLRRHGYAVHEPEPQKGARVVSASKRPAWVPEALWATLNDAGIQQAVAFIAVFAVLVTVFGIVVVFAL